MLHLGCLLVFVIGLALGFFLDRVLQKMTVVFRGKLEKKLKDKCVKARLASKNEVTKKTDRVTLTVKRKSKG
jgi:hypothetical protein